MKICHSALLVLILMCSCYGSPLDVEEQALSLSQDRDVDIFANTRKLIQDLAENLRKAAEQAIEAVRTFNAGILDQVNLMRESLLQRIQQLRDQVNEAIKKVTDRFTGAGSAVRECIKTHRQQADDLFNSTMLKTLNCADERIKEVIEMITNLTSQSSKIIDFTKEVLIEMRNCTEQNNGNLWGTGTCLGGIVIKTEAKGAVFLAQSGFAISRINLAFVTLPASLEVCAGTRLLEAGMGTAKIVLGIGGCSVSSAFSALTGNNNTTAITPSSASTL